MLRQRVITALIMAVLFLLAVFYLPVFGLALMFALVVAGGGWEWAQLAGWQSNLARTIYVAVLLAIMAGLYHYCQLGDEPTRSHVQPFLGLACLWWSFALLWVKGYPGSAALWGSVPVRSVMGFLVLAFSWLAAVYLLSFPMGGLLMVVLIVTVATADIGAYFVGKAVGRHSLSPQVSPAKTWEGFWGGMGCALLLSLLLWWWLPAQVEHISMAAVITVILVTALTSVVGDLTVSMVKRESGLKDSGGLLPGHGGVLDRLDSICGAVPVFALGLLLAGW